MATAGVGGTAMRVGKAMAKKQVTNVAKANPTSKKIATEKVKADMKGKIPPKKQLQKKVNRTVRQNAEKQKQAESTYEKTVKMLDNAVENGGKWLQNTFNSWF